MRSPAVCVSVSILLLASLALAGCGGGGGGGTPSTGNDSGGDPPPGSAAHFASHPDFRGQWGLETIRADHAYEILAGDAERGAEVRPGAGVSIGFIDTGIDEGHPAFAGKSVRDVPIGDAEDETGTEGFSHGTAVASVAAAVRRDDDDFPMHGVAWAADIEMFVIPFDAREGTAAQLDAAEAALYGGILGDAMRDFDILNLSFGSGQFIDDWTREELESDFPNTIAALAQADAQEKTILVWAAGNEHGKTCEAPAPGGTLAPGCVEGEGGAVEGVVDAGSPDLFAGLAARIEELRGHSIAVVAVGRDGEILDASTGEDGTERGGSNRCGIAAQWCIAAPGEEVRVAYSPGQGDTFERGTGRGRGTSYAAPMVSGALAVMRGFFDRQEMSNVDLVELMFESADKTGVYAGEDGSDVSEVYGQGLLDLAAALTPMGSTSVATGGTVRQGGVPLSATALRLGGAFGDGVRRSLGGRTLMVFDERNTPFHPALAGQVSPSEAGGTGDLGASLRALLAAPLSAWRPDEAGAPQAPSPLSSSSLQHLAHVRGGGGALPALRWGGDGSGVSGAFFSTGRGSASPAAGGGPASGMVFSWRPSSGPLAALRLRAGGLYEEEGIFGTSAEGAFGRISNRSLFAGMERRWEEVGSGWRLAASAEMGMSSPDWKGTLVADASPVVTSGFSFRAARAAPWGGDRRRRGWLEWSLTQPLRVERADVTLSAPVKCLDCRRDGTVVRERWQLNAAPSGRQLDLGMRWEHPLAAHGALRLGAVRTYDPGHDADAPPRWSLLAGLRYAF